MYAYSRADSRLASSQWETSLQSNTVSHWLGATLESTLVLVLNQSHKSHNAPVPCPIIHHSEQKCVHFCSEWCIVGYGTGVLWDLWIWSIKLSHFTGLNHTVGIIHVPTVLSLRNGQNKFFRWWINRNPVERSVLSAVVRTDQLSHDVFQVCCKSLLTHKGLTTHICVSELGHCWFR